jgi:hypothetical protein
MSATTTHPAWCISDHTLSDGCYGTGISAGPVGAWLTDYGTEGVFLDVPGKDTTLTLDEAEVFANGLLKLVGTVRG